jgi:hypothetical protein
MKHMPTRNINFFFFILYIYVLYLGESFRLRRLGFGIVETRTSSQDDGSPSNPNASATSV